MNFPIPVKILVVLLAAIFVMILLTFLSHRAVELAAQERLFTHVTPVPKKKAALVPGCAKTVANGRRNSYFQFRIDAAAELFHAGKCEYLIVSGDNSRKNYDEPTDMQKALIGKGVPENRIYRDFAGFRTLDSIVRAKEIFGQDDIIVVSQPFHNKRAIFIAKRYGINAVGFNCEEVKSRVALKTNLREYPARAKMMLDLFLLDTKPRFLGPKIALGDPPPGHGS